MHQPQVVLTLKGHEPALRPAPRHQCEEDRNSARTEQRSKRAENKKRVAEVIDVILSFEVWTIPLVSIVLWVGYSDSLKSSTNYSTSSDPHHVISIICLHAMVRSMFPWS